MRKTFLLFGLIFFAKLVNAQSGKTVSVDFNKATITQFAYELKAKTGYQFYVDTTQFDSLKITLHINQQSLEKVLDQAFQNTNYHYTIIAELQQVFLTKNKQIETRLAPGYFTNTVPEKTATVIDNTTDFNLDKEHPVTEANVENKLYTVGTITNNTKNGNVTLSGYVKDIKTGEAVVGGSVSVANTKAGIATDQYGYYTLT
ncbi:MAG: TonB-dependent receptor, partial [Mucilaginibacter sp.]|nr:TonB-dependent receptor [Mucilaginibacter sp.]